MKKYFLHTVVIVSTLLAAHVRSQSLSLFNIDRSGYPVITAFVSVTDKDGKRINGLTAGDFVIIENGKQRTVTLYNCPAETPTNKISAALSIDISGSMRSTFNGGRSVDYAKITCENLINALPMPPTEVALQQCDDRADILKDFTTDRAALLAALAPIDAYGNNDFTEHLLNPYSGLLTIAAGGKYKRYAILCTDAYWPRLSPPTLQRCLDICSESGITLYAILFNDQSTNAGGVRQSLQEIATASGGWLREGIVTQQDAEDMALELSGELGGSAACRISWETDKNCDPVITTEISVPKYNLTTTATRLNPLADGYVEAQPFSTRFGKVTPPLSGQRTVKLLARNGDVVIKSLSVSDPSITINPIATPFTMLDGTTRDVTLIYTPVDTSFISAYLNIGTDYCEDSSVQSLPISAGVAPARNLRITKPVAGEVFVVGEDTVIEWTGVNAADPVKLEFSANGGTTYNVIADSAFGLKCRWRIPLPPSTQCRVRGTLVTNSLPSTLDIVLVNRYRVFDSLNLSPTYAEISPDNKQVMVSGGGVHLYDAATSALQYSYTGSKTTAAIPPTYLNKDMVVGCGTSWIFGLNTTPGSQGVAWNRSSGTFSSFSVAPDRTKVATTSKTAGTEVWRTTDGGRLLQLWGHLGDATNSVFDFNSSHLATAGDDQTARVWDLSSGGVEMQKLTVSAIDACSGVLFHPSAWKLITTTETGTLERWNIASGISETNFPLTMTTPDRMALSGDGTKLLVGSSINPVAGILEESGGTYTLRFAIADAFTNWNVKPPMTKNGQHVVFRKSGNPTVAAVWDLNTDRIVGEMPHPGVPRSVTFSDDERYIVTTTDREAFLWEISNFADTGRKVDTTGIFTTVAPMAASVDVDMGQVLVGAKKDSVITAFITNTGTYKVRIDSVTIGGVNGSDFYLYSAPQQIVDVGESTSVEFAFIPTATGLRTATVTIHARSGNLQQSLIGTGVRPFIETLGNVVDFGLHAIGELYDSALTVAVTNVGTSAITITSTDILGPDKSQFSIVTGGGSFTLAPAESHSMTLRFAPQFIGRASSNIGFTYNGVGSPAVLRLYGQGIGGTVYIPDDSAAPGDVINIPLLLKGVKTYIQSDGATKFSAEVSFDATVLTPVDALARGTIQNGVQAITLNNAWDGTSDTLAVIPMKAGLGASEKTTVGIPLFTWLDDAGKEVPLAIDVVPGTFTLTGLCDEGGKRLFNPTGEAKLSIHPNPIDESQATISFDIIESGITKIEVYNTLGRKIYEHHAADLEVGSHQITFDASQLGAGCYYCILSTPSIRLERMLYISK